MKSHVQIIKKNCIKILSKCITFLHSKWPSPIAGKIIVQDTATQVPINKLKSQNQQIYI